MAEKKKVRLNIKDDEDNEKQLAPEVETEEAELTPEEAPKVEPPVARIKEADMVTLACYANVDPAPIVGHPGAGGYSFRDHGVMKLEERKNYVMPRRVAEHLVDKKIGAIVVS